MDEALVDSGKKEVRKYRGKHFSQMEHAERVYLMKKLEMILNKPIKFSDHAIEALKSRRLRPTEIIKSLKFGQIIDYRLIYNKYNEICDHRITVRSTFTRRRNWTWKDTSVIYVSLSLDTPFVVTTFYDKADNMLLKVNMKKYDSEIKIIE